MDPHTEHNAAPRPEHSERGAVVSSTQRQDHPAIPPIRSALYGGVLMSVALLVLAACSTLWPWNSPAQRIPLADPEPAYGFTPSLDEPRIRVLVVDDQPSVTISGTAPILIRTPTHDTLVASPPLTINAGAVAFLIEDDRGMAWNIERNTIDEPLRVEPTRDALLINGKRLPGVSMIHGKRADNQPLPMLDVVEHIPIEQYLPGVIAKELYANWSPEAFKAQAIAARSYALHERQRRLSKGLHYDILSTTQSQVYGGETDNATAINAVRDTQGLALTWSGHILRAYYSSTTGGRAANARDVWPTTNGMEFNLAPPIQASPRDDADAWSPRNRWTVTRNKADLTKRLTAFGERMGYAIRHIKLVNRIEPSQRNAFGRPTHYKVYDANGKWWELSAEELRVACNTTQGTGLEAPSPTTRVYSSDFTVESNGNTLVFTGQGFGHGVGMSQFGAEGMARKGATAQEILNHYYPGADLTRLY